MTTERGNIQVELSIIAPDLSDEAKSRVERTLTEAVDREVSLQSDSEPPISGRPHSRIRFSKSAN